MVKTRKSDEELYRKICAFHGIKLGGKKPTKAEAMALCVSSMTRFFDHCGDGNLDLKEIGTVLKQAIPDDRFRVLLFNNLLHCAIRTVKWRKN